MSEKVETLGEAIPRLQAQVREILAEYKAIPAGAFGAMHIEMTLQKTDKAVMSGDVIQMLEVYEELKEIVDSN